jgi:c-di-GMP-related signal transduction protein
LNTDNMTQNCLIGRQPILDRNEEVVSYELLFRSVRARESAVVADASNATASVIINTLSEFGLEQVLGSHRGFINVDLDLLMNDSIEILPTERIVLELLESLSVTPELIERCRALKNKGFALALDDHKFDPAYIDLYEIAEIVKIDLMQSPKAHLPDIAEYFRPYPVRLLAEKVETRDEFLQCLELGFDYFQGFFFARPTVMEKRRVDETASTLFNLIRLLSEDADMEEIEQAFSKSPGLTYKLLLLVNSVSIGLRENVRSIRHAVAILGRGRIKQWAQLALFASDDSRGMRNPLVEMAAVRAGFMEQLARLHPLLRENREAPDLAFLAGILSLLETIYNVSAGEVVSTLNLSTEIKDALLSRAGTVGRLLELAELMERNFFRVAPDQIDGLGLTQEDVLAAQVKAYQWLGESF